MLPQLRRLALVCLLAFLTASCGGGGDGDVANSGGIGGTGISSGSISSFGSIFVNGIEFDLTGATIKVDDLPGCDPKDLCSNPLKLGMVVNASVHYNDDGKTGSAQAVEAEAALEGPVTSVGPAANGVRTVAILGTTVIISQDDTVIDDALGLSFDHILVDDVLEIHGFFNENDELQATRVEKKASGGGAGSEVELKGKIKLLSNPTPPGTFQLRNRTVYFDGATVLEDIPGGALSDGLFVAVKGTLHDDSADSDVDAIKIEGKQLGGDVAKVSVEGIIASVDTADNRVFVLNTAVGPVPVNAVGAIFEPSGLVPAPGLEVEVEGASVGGTLVATKVKIGIRLKIEATVQNVSGSGKSGTLTLLVNPMPMPDGQVLPVEVNDSTKMVDQTGTVIPAASLELGDINITPPDFLKINARLGESGLIATQVRRTNPGDVVVQGLADLPPTGNPGPSGPLVSVFGIQFDTDLDTQYKDIGGNTISDPNEFFADVHSQSLIRIKDKTPTDGVLDEASFED
jgi:hypothetical protein